VQQKFTKSMKKHKLVKVLLLKHGFSTYPRVLAHENQSVTFRKVFSEHADVIKWNDTVENVSE